MLSDLSIKSVMISLLLVPTLSMAAAKTIPPEKPAAPPTEVSDAQEPIYGYQLMTEDERTSFRTQMQNATTAEEREQIRLQHREQMLERAKAQGVTLPDTPMMMRQGMGPGKGPGMGMGSGSGGSSGSGNSGGGSENSGGGGNK